MAIHPVKGFAVFKRPAAVVAVAVIALAVQIHRMVACAAVGAHPEMSCVEFSRFSATHTWLAFIPRADHGIHNLLGVLGCPLVGVKSAVIQPFSARDHPRSIGQSSIKAKLRRSSLRGKYKRSSFA